MLRDSYKNYARFYENALQKGLDEKIFNLEMSAKTIAWDIIGFTIHQSSLFVMGFYVEEDAKKLLKRHLEIWIP